MKKYKFKLTIENHTQPGTFFAKNKEIAEQEARIYCQNFFLDRLPLSYSVEYVSE